MPSTPITSRNTRIPQHGHANLVPIGLAGRLLGRESHRSLAEKVRRRGVEDDQVLPRLDVMDLGDRAETLLGTRLAGDLVRARRDGGPPAVLLIAEQFPVVDPAAHPVRLWVAFSTMSSRPVWGPSGGPAGSFAMAGIGQRPKSR